MSGDGSPTPGTIGAPLPIHEDSELETTPAIQTAAVGDGLCFQSNTMKASLSVMMRDVEQMQGVKRNNSDASSGDAPLPLTTSKLGNVQPRVASRKASFKQKVDSDLSGSTNDGENSPKPIVDELLARLNEQEVEIAREQQQNRTPTSSNAAGVPTEGSSSGSSPITNQSDKYVATPGTEPSDLASVMVDAAEVLRLKKELEDAKSKIARMDQELSQTRITKHTLDQAMGPPSEVDFRLHGEVSEQTISNLQNALNASTRPSAIRQGSWKAQDDARSDSSALWGSGSGLNASTSFSMTVTAPAEQPSQAATSNNWSQNAMRSWYNGGAQSISPQPFGPVHPPRGHPHLRVDTSLRPGNVNRYLNEPAHFPVDQSFRGHINPPARPHSAYDMRYQGWNPYTPSPTTDGTGISPPLTPMSAQSMQSMQYMPPMGMPSAPVSYHSRPVGSRLSPTASEFNADNMSLQPWAGQVGSTMSSGSTNTNPTESVPDYASTLSGTTVSGTTYVTPLEPVNYRRLLDRNMNCNWKYIVDKIVCNNDQQASIFLQQKLKVGTTDQKYQIVEAIIAQAYPLMINRFGNFLVQRCFEHGTPEQVVAIANVIRGNTLSLSMDAFGCHVIQKAFDSVPEEYKAIMVHELLRRIPETVVHRYACHVWQKLFELRWSDSPPQIMKYVNEALRGMWHEVALGETGSLVVQNIFENCLEEDKRPCINEVLASIDVISHGQFGNWCIQHICEHGAPQDRNRAIDHILRFATEYSMDQYASKVIEKCLKVGGTEFLDRYLDRVCEGRNDRPRIPLIDIAGDQFGNYLIQYILTHASPHHREIVASQVRKHMVSLRGSKYGSRVAMLCCNPAFATRPGPPTGMNGMRIGPYTANVNPPRSIYGGAYR